MLVFKSIYLEIFYYDTLKLVETRWLSSPTSIEYRKGLNNYLEVIKNNDVKRWLGDYRLAAKISVEDEKWTTREWAPQYLPLTGKIKMVAKVSSKELFKEKEIKKIKVELEPGTTPFIFQEFENYDEAMIWVLSK